jgi:tetratricopeptide (TPR) repeat protein
MAILESYESRFRQWLHRRALLLPLAALALLLLVGTLRFVTGAAQLAAPPHDPAARPAVTDPVLIWQSRIAQRPDDAGGYAALGLALLQKVRENYDVALYAQAAAAFDQALQRDPQQLDALVGRGMLALALHDFTGALAIGDQVTALSPYKAAGHGIRVDALVELGRYAEAVAALQQMVNVRPDLESYSRVSYLRELHGDPDGAIAAMQMAAATALPGSEPWLWTTTQLGHLYWGQGDLAHAEQLYRAVLQRRADYPFAQFGLARIAAAQGRQEQALAILHPLVARLPLPEFLIALGDLYAGQGNERQAQAQYDLVRVIQQLNAGAGMNVDLELAAFDVSHGADAATALYAARAAYAERPTIYAADALAWALHRRGDDDAAWRYSQEALRLGTQDPLLYLHAAAIADRRGDAAAAEGYWGKAEAINPHHSPWQEYRWH